MAIGRISGPMLYSNLERQGVDLAVEGNLIYADVTQLRVGIRTNTPDAELQVVGQSHLGNIVVTGNVISSTTGRVNLGTTANVVITGGAADYVLVTDGAGHLRWDEISNLDQTWGNLFFSGNQISITQLNGNLELAANGSGYVVAVNNFYAPNIVAGNVDAVYFNGNIRSNEIVAAGNISAPYVESTFYGNLFGNVSGTNSLFTGNVNAEYFNGNVRSNNIITTGNVTAQYFVGDLSGNIVGTLQGNVTGNISGSNAVFTGNISSSWFNGNITGSNSNFTTANAAIFYGNIFAQQVTAPVGDLHLSAATDNPNNIIRFDSVSAFDIPSGTTEQRPPTPDFGYVRYNTDLGTIEWWGGSSWIPGSNFVNSQNIIPDGVNNTYTLGQSTTESSILVNINGTIQQAGAGAYSVTGNQITFAEVPLVTDIIEIRFIAGGVTALTFNFANIASNVNPSANVTYDLGSSSRRWKDLWLSNSSIHLGNVVLSAPAGNLLLPSGTVIANVDLETKISNIDLTISNLSANISAYQYYSNIKIGNNNNANLVVDAITNSTDSTSGALVVRGGLGVGANVNFAGNTVHFGKVIINDDTNAVPYVMGSGAFHIAGGMSIGKDFWVGGNIYVANVISQSTTILEVNEPLVYLDATNYPYNYDIGVFSDFIGGSGNLYQYTGAVRSYQTNEWVFFSNLQTPPGGGIVSITSSDIILDPIRVGNIVAANTTPSTSTDSGALIVKGGAGIGGNLYIAGSAGNSIVATGNLSIAGNILPRAGNVAYNIGAVDNWWNIFYGKSTQAQYADLAEKYESDADYLPGTVVVFGGDKEITISNITHDTRVAGVISQNPAYLMNATATGLPVAFTGRVFCKVKGPVTKGTVLTTSNTPGVAEALIAAMHRPGCVLGKSLEQITNNEIKTIEIVVGRF